MPEQPKPAAPPAAGTPAAPPAITPPTPAPSPPTAPPAPEPPAAPPAPAPAPEAPVDFMDQFRKGLGIAVGEGIPAEAPKPPVPNAVVGETLARQVQVMQEQRERTPPAPAPDPNAPPAPATPDPATPEAPPATPPTEPTKVEVERRPRTEDIVSATVKKVLEAQQPQTPAPGAPATPPATPAAPAVDPFESQLTEVERDELELARYAAKVDPKLAEYPNQLLGFYKKVDAYVKAEGAKDPERTFNPEEDEAFRKFLRANKPAISPSARRHVETMRITERVTEDLTKKQNAELETIKHRQHVLETTPRIERGVSEYHTGVTQFIAGDEQSPASAIIKRANEVGWQKAEEEDPMFAPVVKGFTERSTSLAAQYLSLVSGVSSYDKANPDHVWLVQFVQQQGRAFALEGGDARNKDGRTFLPLGEYNDLVQRDPAKAQNHWSFGERDILERLAVNTKVTIEKTIKTEQDRLAKAGYARGTPAVTPAVPPPPAPKPASQSHAPPAPAPPSPKATPSAAPGLAATKPVGSEFSSFFDRLGVKSP